jgi:hypothetical protein
LVAPSDDTLAVAVPVGVSVSVPAGVGVKVMAAGVFVSVDGWGVAVSVADRVFVEAGVGVGTISVAVGETVKVVLVEVSVAPTVDAGVAGDVVPVGVPESGVGVSVGIAQLAEIDWSVPSWAVNVAVSLDPSAPVTPRLLAPVNENGMLLGPPGSML